MKVKKLLAYTLLPLALNSCIQDEAPNSEAAIDQCTGDDVQYAQISAASRTVTLYVNKGADLSRQALRFELPQGAYIKLDGQKANDVPFMHDQDNDVTYSYSGVADFSGQGVAQPTRRFTVVSEDGEWQPSYAVNLVLTEIPLTLKFDHLFDHSPYDYDILFERETSTNNVLQWSSGNPGFKLTAMASTPQEYPTLMDRAGYSGGCAKLVTSDTGSFGAMVKMYIAAGNLFVGRFDLSNALTNAPKATKFGFTFYKKPLRLTGWYKYKAGSQYTESGQPVSGKTDTGDIYAILYEPADKADMIDGEWETSPAQKAKIVSMARMTDGGGTPEADNWTPFDLPFNAYEGRAVDARKLQDGKYKLAIVFSSSLKGATFAGALGSTLYVDEVNIVCE
ncbi:MAG: PCMD domain-containing protein [Mediterranea sp.]|jgi:hypothetical protein|nr:PCMD domain-containing protein [Mediterranea sp.]